MMPVFVNIMSTPREALRVSICPFCILSLKFLLLAMERLFNEKKLTGLYRLMAKLPTVYNNHRNNL